MHPLLLVPLALASPRVSLSVQRLPGGDALDVTVSNAGPGSITVASCETLQVERFDPEGKRWTPVGTGPCHRTEPAMALAPGENHFDVPLSIEASTLIRVVLVYGVDCHDGLALDEAGCTRYDAAISSSLTAFPEGGR